ncbi:MAG: hypothetical protein RLZ75_1549 [Pseudomonadota bacterium]
MEFLQKINREWLQSLVMLDWGYIDSQKSKALQKIQVLKDDYDQHKRAKKEDELYKKELVLNTREQSLKEKEQQLSLRETLIKRQERKLRAKENKPKYVFFACISLTLLIYLLSITVFQVEQVESELQLGSSVLKQEKVGSE